jgi:hypothetical protein
VLLVQVLASPIRPRGSRENHVDLPTMRSEGGHTRPAGRDCWSGLAGKPTTDILILTGLAAWVRNRQARSGPSNLRTPHAARSAGLAPGHEGPAMRDLPQNREFLSRLLTELIAFEQGMGSTLYSAAEDTFEPCYRLVLAAPFYRCTTESSVSRRVGARGSRAGNDAGRGVARRASPGDRTPL